MVALKGALGRCRGEVIGQRPCRWRSPVGTSAGPQTCRTRAHRDPVAPEAQGEKRALSYF